MAILDITQHGEESQGNHKGHEQVGWADDVEPSKAEGKVSLEASHMRVSHDQVKSEK